ncbi:MAG: DUF885 domain-containing protein [Candidatus Dormibacteraeota bacterium]|nr:DUF885 domain-containing protein [Candidatus Dormibacteraeota bacterium]
MNSGEELARLDQEFFDCMHSIDPLSATMLGVSGYDSQLPDPSAAAAARGAARVARVEQALSRLRDDELTPGERVDREVMRQLAWSLRTNLEDGLWALDASAAGYVSPQAMAFQAIPTAPLDSRLAVSSYLERLSKLGDYLDRVAERYRDSLEQNRPSTRAGVLQAVAQLDGHLGRQVETDVFLKPLLRAREARSHDRERARQLITDQVRPAMRRLMDCLSQELLPGARPDSQVGLAHVEGGPVAYERAVRRHTTTELTPERIHQIGLDALSSLQDEWREIGGRVFGPISFPELRDRLRADPALRFNKEAEIVQVVQAALDRAEAARDRFFPHFEIAPCVVEEIDPVEAGNSALAYYRGPSEGGSRPGAHCVLTADPKSRYVYEYEALAFHESTPGHHLQIASAQTLTHIPAYRRHLDAEVCSYVEGWGLYCERLADEMGLYSSDLQRLGMLSFDALRACRLVVDTGMHRLGWSRQEAVDFMWENTATTMANVRNEIDRYIAWPGQALAYMIGREEIRRLRKVAADELGAAFDLSQFHGAVLSEGPLPLPVLGEVVRTWQRSRGGARQ